MPFMIPLYLKKDFHTAPNRCQEMESVPADVFGTLNRMMDEIGTRDQDRTEGYVTVGKWWARLSAPGYTDATEWSGPFDSIEQAHEAIRDMYEVDPETGEDLDESEIDDDFAGLE